MNSTTLPSTPVSSARGDTSPTKCTDEQTGTVTPEPEQRIQPWKALLETEMKSGENPWLHWKPNPNDFGEKPWLDINWEKAGEGSRDVPMISGYSVGHLRQV